MRLAGLCLQSPAGVRKEDSEHRRPYCRKRGRSGVIVLFLVLLALAVTAAEGYQDNEMPPPPGRSVRQQLSEQDLRSIHCCMDDTIKHLETLVRSRREGAKRCREEAKKMDKEADELQERVKVLRKTLQGCAKQDQPEEGESPGEAQGPDTTQKLKLKFNGSLRKDTIYGKESLLEHSNGAPIEIAICSGDQIITSGDLSSLEVEIVALKRNHNCNGDWTEEDFDRQIIRSGHGLNMVSVLDGETIVKLDRGKASLGNIHFKEGSHRVGVDFFVLAARVSTGRSIIGTTRVEEAFMDDCPFRVLSERSKANEKSDILKLHDGVHRLKGIKKNGNYDKRLKTAGITTVKEFLMALNEDREKLQRETLEIKSENNKPWRDMVEHAMKCDLGDCSTLLKSCTFQDNKKREVTLFFDVVHCLVGAEFNGRFVAKGEFNKAQEAFVDGLLKLAYEELKLNDKFDYIMEDNRPVNTHASTNAAGSRSVPISAAENLGSASGIDCADAPLPGTAGQNAPEPSRSDHRNEIANQGVGQDQAPKGDHDDDAGALSVSDVPKVEVLNGTDGRVYMLDLHPQGENHTPRGGSDWRELLASVMESDISNPVLDRSSGAPGAILGDANRNAATYRASAATFQAAAPGPESQPSNANPFEDPPGQGTIFVALDQSQPNTAPSFASTWNPFEDPPGQVTTVAALDQSQPSTAPGFASLLNPFEDPPGQAGQTTFAALQSQPTTVSSFASSWNPFEDPPSQGNKSQQA